MRAIPVNRFMFIAKRQDVNEKRIRRLLLVVMMVVLLLGVSGPASSTVLQDTNKVLNLRPPSFISVARAEGASIPAAIENEAGISAWLQSPLPIALNSFRSVFRVIEVETTDYIIGTVRVPNYDESEELHVYVHRDGWILGDFAVTRNREAGLLVDYAPSHGMMITKQGTRDGIASSAFDWRECQ